tara:strand:+ start:118 stop:921 length:804 start_codon:yes stop_codon:yes gene_type:complete
MRKNQLLEKLRADQVVLGLTNMYPASGIIEGMGRGWDFIWIDGQHGEMSYDSCLHATQACTATGIDSLIRVPGDEYSTLGRFADLAPAAIMVPMVETPEQAQAIVQGLHFPPLGNRSYGGRRVIDLDGREFYKRELLVVVQIETLGAVERAEAIAAVEGVDVLFFGPDDMKMRMGIPINTQITDHPKLSEALEKTATAARNAGGWAATVTGTPAGLEMTMGMGYRMLVGGGDIGFLRTLSASRLAEFRGVLEGFQGDPGDGESGGVY